MTLSEGLADISSALGALQKASDILKGWASLRTDKERSAKLIELNGQILSAQTSAIQANAAQAALIEQISDLKEDIARFETWDREKQRYELRHIGDGAFACFEERCRWLRAISLDLRGMLPESQAIDPPSVGAGRKKWIGHAQDEMDMSDVR